MKLLVKFAAVCLLGSATFFSVSDDRPDADQEIVEDLVEYCKEVANDEGTGDLNLPQFLLKCVNQELEYEGYKPIKKLPG